MSRKFVLALVAIVLAAAGGGAYFLTNTSSGAFRGDISAKPGFELHPWDRAMGNPNAKVVLIEYAALTCPHCALFARDVLPQIKKNYIDTGKVYYVFRLYPRMPEDGAAERLARCVPADRYFQIIDLVFENQQHWDPEFGVLDVHGGLVNIGQIAGLSRDQVDKCIADTAADAHINAAAQEAETRYNLTGTPTFVINGVAQPSGGMTYEMLAQLLDQSAGG